MNFWARCAAFINNRILLQNAVIENYFYLYGAYIMATVQNELDFDFARSPADKILFLKHVQSELDEIREEVEETCAVVSEVEPVPEQAYNDTLSLMEQISHGIPMPDLMWLEDGGIGLEWRPGEGIATISLYGDGNVICGVFLVTSVKLTEFVPCQTMPFSKGSLRR